MVKSGDGVTTLSLTAEAGRSILVKGIWVEPVADAYLTLDIGRKSVGYFRVDTTPLGNLLHPPLPDSNKPNILDFMSKAGIFEGYPLAEGQTLTLSGLGATAIIGCITYDEYDAADIKDTQQNGEKSDALVFVSDGQPTANIATATTTELDATPVPSTFCNFPWTGDVPAKHRITVYGFLASERAADDGTTAANYVRSTFWRFVRGTEFLFDSDLHGLPANAPIVGAGGAFVACGGSCPAGDFTDLYERPPLMFDPPLVFEAGEELEVSLTSEVHTTPGTLLVAEAVAALILKVERLT